MSAVLFGGSATDRFNSAMLTTARDSRGLSQKALAELADLSQGYISKMEAGLVEPSEEALAALGRVLRYPVSFFFDPSTVAGPGVGCHYRRRQSATVSTLRTLQARMNVSRIRFERLLQGVEVEHPNEFFRLDIEDFDDSPEEVAVQLRAAWNVPFGPIANLTALIESAGGLLVREPFHTDKVDEMCQWLKGHAPFFFMNSDTPADRYRWSLAHGLGHVVMHQVPMSGAEMEEQANRFASEFLAPSADIGPELRDLKMTALPGLKRHWGMSMAALIMRAADLGEITERQKRSFFTRLGQLGYRKKEPYTITDEAPETLRSLIDFHISEHGYSVDELVTLTESDPMEFRQTYINDLDARQANLRRVM